MHDNINHPRHYTSTGAVTSDGSPIEVIDITETLNFNLGNVVKYVCRSGKKSDNPVEDLRKAQWYINREIARLERVGS